MAQINKQTNEPQQLGSSSTAYANVVDVERVLAFGAEDPANDIVGGALGVHVRARVLAGHRGTSEPPGISPGQSVQDYCRIALFELHIIQI